jgi:AbiV family abortive infection protein
MQTEIQRANQHLIETWKSAAKHYKNNNHQLAGFLAITIIEEVGKFNLFYDGELQNELSKKKFYNHKEKYRIAVGSTLLVNSRVSRIYTEKEKIFANWFREDKLFEIRNKCLYIEHENGIPKIPQDMVTSDECHLLVCIAGEVLAEIQGEMAGTGPEEWNKMIKCVDEFRNWQRGSND